MGPGLRAGEEINVLAIPGRIADANPEPLNTDSRLLGGIAVKHLEKFAFMGSGSAALRYPGMTKFLLIDFFTCSFARVVFCGGLDPFTGLWH
jgi:hypothetical protein